MASYTHPQFRHWADFLSHARDGYSRPIANNTRVHWVGEDAIAFRLHATDVVTLHRNGTKQLSTGGWYTPTTRDRISSWGSRHIFTIDGHWCVRAREIASDPEPEYGWRAIPRPYSTPDPGPEPVDDGEGCIADTTEEITHRDEHILAWARDLRGDERPDMTGVEDAPTRARHVIGYLDHFLDDSLNWYFADVWETVTYGEESYRWNHPTDSTPRTRKTYRQCPHCQAFQAKHTAWKVAMEGGGYGHRRTNGYLKMCEMLERWGSREGWQAAYIEEWHKVRQARKAHREWQRRNYVPFSSGIFVDADGYATLATARRWRRELKLILKEERRRARVHAQVERERKRIEAKHAKRRKRELAVRRQVAEALANSLIAELEIARRESFV